MIAAGILGGLAPIAAKIALVELPPLTTTFIRLTIMFGSLAILTHRMVPHLLQHWKRLLIVGLFWSGNVLFFIFGIKYTTAAISQLLYGGVPLLMLLEQTVVTSQRLRTKQLVGILLGIIGTIVVVHPGKGGMGLGTWHGNILIFSATISYSLYLLMTKLASVHVSTLGITTAAAFVCWIASGILMFIFEPSQIALIGALSLFAWMALLFLGLIAGTLMWFLYNFGLKHGSPVVVSSMLYISTVTAGISGYVTFGEKITSSFIFGGALLLTGVYLVSRTHLRIIKA